MLARYGSNRSGGSGDNYRVTLFDDQAGTSVSSGRAPFNGSYRPYQSLSRLNGLQANGIWTLRIDDRAGWDWGTLTSWGLEINTAIKPVSVLKTTTSNINVSDLTGTVTDVNVTMNIAHANVGDLKVELQATTGAKITLVDRQGGTGDNFTNTRFDKNQGVVINGYAPFNAVFNAQGNLDEFDGLSPNGTWNLIVTDYSNGGNGSSAQIVDWSIDLRTDAVQASTIEVPALSGVISDVNVKVDISHPNLADLTLTLVHGGKSVVLASYINLTGNTFSGTFDETAGANITEPVGALSAFNGESATGDWTLQIVDDKGNYVGDLKNWELQIRTTPTSVGVTVADVPGLIKDINIGVDLDIANVKGVKLQLQHTAGGVTKTVELFDGSRAAQGINMSGLVFDDAAAVSIHGASVSAPFAGR